MKIAFIAKTLIKKTLTKRTMLVKTQIIKKGNTVVTQKSEKKDMWMLAYTFKKEQLLGVAYGITGILYMLLQAYEVSAAFRKDHIMRILLKNTIVQVVSYIEMCGVMPNALCLHKDGLAKPAQHTYSINFCHG